MDIVLIAISILPLISTCVPIQIMTWADAPKPVLSYMVAHYESSIKYCLQHLYSSLSKETQNHTQAMEWEKIKPLACASN